VWLWLQTDKKNRTALPRAAIAPVLWVAAASRAEALILFILLLLTQKFFILLLTYFLLGDAMPFC
jgi:hypothetical protein